MFTVTQNEGVYISFANGWTVSIQWGVWNCCHNKDKYVSFTPDAKVPPSPTAEVAVFPTKGVGEWQTKRAFRGIRKLNDTVAGWITPEEVAKVINRVSKWKSANEATI